MNIKQIIKPMLKTNLDNIAIISIEAHNSNIVVIKSGELINISSLPISWQ
jgi:hypothetical protein